MHDAKPKTDEIEVNRAPGVGLKVAHARTGEVGTHETAVRIEQQSSALEPDLRYASAAVRLYADLCDATGDEDYRVRRDFFSMLIADLEEDAAPSSSVRP